MSPSELFAPPPTSFNGSVRSPPVVLRTGFHEESCGKVLVHVPAAEAGIIETKVDAKINEDTKAKILNFMNFLFKREFALT